MPRKVRSKQPAPPTRDVLLRKLGFCLNRTIWECPESEVVFRGCPEATQLAWRVLDLLSLGLEAVVVQGKGKDTESERWVDHIWIEIPSLGIRVETNASQILGRPQFVDVLELSDFEDRYQGGFEHMEFLDRLTKKGDAFYYDLAKKVAQCVRKRSR